MEIRAYSPADLSRIVKLWNLCVQRGEALYRPLIPAYFEEKFLHPGTQIWIAEENSAFLGFVIGCVKTDFLPGQTAENTPGFLSVLMVSPDHRCRGVGSALLSHLETRFAEMGKKQCQASGSCPVNLDWVIPNTPGHEHNNLPGADTDGMIHPFLLHHGYGETGRVMGMYLNLAKYQKSPVIEEKRAALAARGIIAGLYDPAQGCEFDGMCDRVGSEYWRSVLQTETAAAHPRPILAAVCDGHIVGFTGPVDKQPNGRGWFSGICTDPNFGGLGIASVLFNDLMVEFQKVGAAYSTLYTGANHHAQRVYRAAGFVPARYFAIMSKDLT